MHCRNAHDKSVAALGPSLLILNILICHLQNFETTLVALV